MKEISQNLRGFLNKKKFFLVLLVIMVSGCTCLYFLLDRNSIQWQEDWLLPSGH